MRYLSYKDHPLINIKKFSEIRKKMQNLNFVILFREPSRNGKSNYWSDACWDFQDDEKTRDDVFERIKRMHSSEIRLEQEAKF